MYDLFWLVSCACGLFVGATEIASRYRDEPLRAIFSLPGICYTAFNALVSSAAYLLLLRYGDKLLPGLTNDKLLASIVAGFSAMAILRTKLFNFRSERGKDIPGGLEAAVAIALQAVDRNIDRNRADNRRRLVDEEVRTIHDPHDKARDYLSASLRSFQNLSEKEIKDLNALFLKIKGTPLNRSSSLSAVSYVMLDILGERTYKNLMTGLREHLGQQQNHIPDLGVSPQKLNSGSL